MLKSLKKEVWLANMELPKHGLVKFTWGNVSGIDRAKGIFAIKPSGVSYEGMTWEDMVLVDLDGKVVEGKYNPSSDTATHLELYKAFPNCGGVVHTHSKWATGFAQAGMPLRALGTTHADHFYGDIPCTRDMTPDEISEDYEKNTGTVIIETFANLDPDAIPGVLVKSHGPFAWGIDAAHAVENAVVMEEIAFMNYHAESMNPSVPAISQNLLDKHYLRKHGANAYYGQGK